jgi:hypothetical protein
MAETKLQKPFDEFEFIMAFEQGDCTDDELIDGFQHLIDNGHAWTLQGSYGRMAQSLIQAGVCHAKQ